MATAIDTKQTIVAINSFIVTTSEFLNQFCSEAHHKLTFINRQIERLETLSILLEHKINSLPTDLSVPPPPTPVSNPTSQPVNPDTQQASEQPPEEEAPAEVEIPEDLMVYKRMLKVRIPREAVKHKMLADGKDPNLIDVIVI